MGKGPTQVQTFEFILSEVGISEKDIGWVLSKLDSQEYIRRLVLEQDLSPFKRFHKFVIDYDI